MLIITYYIPMYKLLSPYVIMKLSPKNPVRKRKESFMLNCDYLVESIDGDYAHLKRLDLPEEETKIVARALLPMEIREGSKLHYEMMQYTLIQ